ncbi:MAG TPA: PilZ domain-containing protein [Tepidisphaeraceae bacterium]|nr:PilZ domain-containing protein [Tepidisphaeraceae bacterium]
MSAESFRELANAITGKQLEADKERRRSTRVEVQTRLPLSLVLKGEHLPAVPIMVRDVSPRGINILYPQTLPAGQQFTVQIISGGKTITLLCTVLHSRQVVNGLHSIGAEFTCVLPEKGCRPATTDEQTLKRIRESVLE